MEKIVIVDFGGTLVKPEVISEANELRSSVLKRALPKDDEHAHSEKLYKTNREFVSKLTGITEDMKVKYRMNNLDLITLTGEQVQNQIATNLFQIGMYMVAKKYKKDIAPKGFTEELVRIQSLGYKIAIVSGMLEIANIKVDYILGQPPVLGVSNEDNMKGLKNVAFVIGDKLTDLTIAPKAKKIFVKWGHTQGGEEEIADYTIEKPSELGEIIC